MAIGIEEAVLVSVFVESIFYGLFLFLFILAVCVIWSRHRESPSTRIINARLLCMLIAMFTLATIHLGVSFSRMLDAFINFGPVGLTAQKLSAVKTPIYLLRAILYGTQNLLGDAFILYRLHLVWNGKRRVCYPLYIAFFGSVVTALGSFATAAKSDPTSSSNQAPVMILRQDAWVISFFVLTLFINAFATSLIAGRIWLVPLRVTQMQGANGNLGPTPVALLESGAFYSFSLVVLLILYVKHTYAQNIVLDSLIQIIGIAFTLVIVRIALGLARAGAVQPESMHIQQVNLSIKSMVDRHNAMAQHTRETWKSGTAPTLTNVGQSDFIACAVEVVHARDADSDDADHQSSQSDGEYSRQHYNSPDEF